MSDDGSYRGGSPYQELADLTGEEPLPALEDPATPPAQPPPSPLLAGFGILLLLVVISVGLFQLFRSTREDGATATTTTTAAPATSTPVGATTTAAPATTTTTAGVTTTADVSDPFVAVGDPIPLDELRLSTTGIGTLEFGSSAAESVGRLVASLGEPDRDSGDRTSTGELGTCAGDTERVVSWGPLAVIVVDGRFAGYRLDIGAGGLSSPAIGLRTLSGLQVGDTIATLEAIYGTENLDLGYAEHPEIGSVFELYRVSDGRLLLWGPIQGPEADDTVLGIYAPDACGA